MADHIRRTVPSDRSHEQLGAFYDRMKQPVGQRQSVPPVHPHANGHSELNKKATGSAAAGESGKMADVELADSVTSMAHTSYAQVVERAMQRAVYDAPAPRRDSERASSSSITGPWVPDSPTHRNELTFDGLVARVKLDAGRMFDALAGAP